MTSGGKRSDFDSYYGAYFSRFNFCEIAKWVRHLSRNFEARVQISQKLQFKLLPQDGAFFPDCHIIIFLPSLCWHLLAKLSLIFPHSFGAIFHTIFSTFAEAPNSQATLFTPGIGSCDVVPLSLAPALDTYRVAEQHWNTWLLPSRTKMSIQSEWNGKWDTVWTQMATWAECF